MRSTFKVLFYLKCNAPKKDGLIPVMCRITINGKIAQFSCKLDVEEKMWSVETGRLTGRSNVALEGNRMLDKIRVGVNKAYQDVFDRDTYVTAEKVRNEYLGMGMNHKTLLAVFRQHNEDYAKLVGKMKSQRSYWKYCVVYKHLSEFIKTRYKVEDIALKELAPAFITDFELFLRVEKGHCTNTVWSYMMPFRSIIFTAINNGWLQRDPFYAYHITKEETKRGYLTKEEITQMINCSFKRKNYELIRDLFIFSVFTGLAYADVKALTTDRLQTFFDGNLWIITRRRKTNTESNIRLLDVPKRIIEKYKGLSKDDHVFPVPSNGRCNTILKELGRQCGFKIRLTYHVARHTNATTVLLSHGVPIETVSRLLGHTDLKTTQIYARITNQKISSDMEILSHKLEKMEKEICDAI